MIVHLFNSSVVSGPETLVLPALAHSGWPVEIWFLRESRLALTTERDPLAYAAKLGLKTREIIIHSRFDWAGINSLAKLLFVEKPQLVHAHDVKASVYLGLANLKNKFFNPLVGPDTRGLPPILVTTHHGVRARFTAKLRLYERFYVLLSRVLFDRILAVSSEDVRLLEHDGLFNTKVRLHLNGVRRHLISTHQKRELRSRYRNEWSQLLGKELASEDLLFGIVGRLSFEKNHLFIFEMFRQLQERWLNLPKTLAYSQSKLRLLVFGSGPLELELKAAVARAAMAESILFLGYQQEMSEKMAALDFVVSFSTAEGLPINLLEAGWAATPVIANAIDGNRDLFVSDELGVSLAPELSPAEIVEKILPFLQNPDAVVKMGQAFQKRVEQNFSEKVWLKNLCAIYSELGLDT